MHMKVQYGNGRTWFFSPVYASPNIDNRKILWEDLISINGVVWDSWLVAGDFNDMA